MNILNVFKKIAQIVVTGEKTVEEIIKKGVSEVIETFNEVANAAKKGYEEIKKEINKIEKQVIEKEINGLKEKIPNLNSIKPIAITFRDNALKLNKSKTGKETIRDIKASVENKNLTAEFYNAIIKTINEFSDPLTQAKKKNFNTFSVTFGGDILDGMTGIQGDVGFVFDFEYNDRKKRWTNNKIKGIANVGGVLGMAVGASANLSFGLWRKEIDYLNGAYMAFEFELDDFEGGGFQFVFSIEKLHLLEIEAELIGFVFTISSGVEAKIALAGGYTFTFPIFTIIKDKQVQIKSKWKGTCINIEKGEEIIQATDDVKPEWQSAKWIFEPVPGKDNTYRIKNVWKNLYLHIENIEKGKNLECGKIKDKWLSAQWLIEDLHGNLRIRNAWKNNIYINNEYAPKVIATRIKDDWESAKWIVQKG